MKLKTIYNEVVKQRLTERKITYDWLSQYIVDNLSDVRANMKTFGFDNVASVRKIKNRNTLASVLGIDSRSLNGYDINEWANTVADILRHTVINNRKR